MSKHGALPRGLDSVPRSLSHEGRFGRMFRQLRPAQFGKNDVENGNNLKALGDAMSASFDSPFDGFDPEESGIPALYTYFGQFIDHDITFDPASSLQKQNDPNGLIDFRTPAFDLDNVYGRGPDDQPYMYDGKGGFLLGDSLTGGDPKATDLPRNVLGRALIGDPRNDENSIVSQLQGIFHRFHNRMLADRGLLFADTQRLVRFHYQHVVMNDFLPRIVHSSVLTTLKSDELYDPNKIQFFEPKKFPFMPVEFSVAAYRLGHSMVRPGYRLNDNGEKPLPIFPVPSQGLNEGLTGFEPMRPSRGIDWGRFVDLDIRAYDGGDAEKKKRLQFAYRIDTSLVNPLHELPPSVASDPPASLAERNLLRGWRLGLPSGQAVARAMKVNVLKDNEILIGKAVDKPDKGDEPIPISSPSLPPIFKGNCPLWTYILAEAMLFKEEVVIPVKENEARPTIKITTPRLGPVGGRIVAEVFLGLLAGDKTSYLNLDPTFSPGNAYGLKDLVAYALGK
jgi:Animal haem peroxidase